MDVVILILALFFVAFVALGAYATVKAVGAVKRGVDRTITQTRRTAENTALLAKSYGLGSSSLTGELAQLRLSLRTSMRATQDALNAGVADDPSLKESMGLFQRLSAHGHELDDELRRLERDPDKAGVKDRLPQLRERLERITHAADSLRWAAHDRAEKFAADDLMALTAQIEIESGALRDWSRTDGLPEQWPEPQDDGAGPPSQTWQNRAEAASGPQAIAAPGPQPVHPWQKKTNSPRPEAAG